MGKVYDDWGRLVEAVLRREKLRQLGYADSVTSSDSSSVLDHDFPLLHAKLTMARLQEQLIYTLTQNKRCFEHGYSSPPTCESIVTSPRQSISSESEDCLVDLLDSGVIPQIKAIADTFFASKYEHEFCEVFVRFGKAAFGVYLTILDVEELSTSNEFGQLEWKSWNATFKKWHFAFKQFIDIYLCEAKLVFDQVLGEYGDASSRCLTEASKPSLTLFSSFARVVAVQPHQPESFFSLLDVYGDLLPLITSLEALFPNEMGSSIRVDLLNLLARLEDYAKAILTELGNTIRTNPPPIPSPNGDIHPLTRFVVHYFLCLARYDRNGEGVNADDKPSILGALSAHLHSVTSALEAKITDMSDLYGDTSLKHMFVMNNIHYFVAKINNSRIGAYFGREWIKRLTMSFRAHALSYQRSTWSSILPLLSCDTWPVDRAKLKSRLRSFNVAFENVRENQAKWFVPDRQLRQELRTSVSIFLVPAYRSFVGRTPTEWLDKHKKYGADELETLMLDLFEGSSK